MDQNGRFVLVTNYSNLFPCLGRAPKKIKDDPDASSSCYFLINSEDGRDSCVKSSNYFGDLLNMADSAFLQER